MNITEKTIIHYKVKFTEEDLALIRFVISSIYNSKVHMSMDDIIYDRCRCGFDKAIEAIIRVERSVLYNEQLTAKDMAHIETIHDMLTSFSVSFPDDEHNVQIEEMIYALYDVKSKFYKELY